MAPQNAKEKAPIISFNLKSIHHADVSYLLSKEGICLRAGHHCSQPLMNHLKINGTLRVSLSIYNTKEEVDLFIKALHKVKKFF